MRCHVEAGQGSQGLSSPWPVTACMKAGPSSSGVTSPVDELLIPGLQDLLLAEAFAEPGKD